MSNVDEKIETLNKRIEEIRSLLAEGNPDVKVDTLAPDVEGLLTTLKQMPDTTARAYQPKLEEMMRNFGEITADFRRIMTAAANDMQTLNQKAKANEAYARSGAETGKKEREG